MVRYCWQETERKIDGKWIRRLREGMNKKTEIDRDRDRD
jgi:hypothetical protein